MIWQIRWCDLAIGDLRLMPCVESLLDKVVVKRRVPLVGSGGARWLAQIKCIIVEGEVTNCVVLV
ncbi:hypothetical protein KY285_017404 [Solanum tuberosum]|nr:hypothetical protein KY285_017404 [Solanum tuberosum]